MTERSRKPWHSWLALAVVLTACAGSSSQSSGPAPTSSDPAPEALPLASDEPVTATTTAVIEHADDGISLKEALEADAIASEYAVMVSGPQLAELRAGDGPVPIIFSVLNAGSEPDRYRIEIIAEPSWVDTADVIDEIEVAPGEKGVVRLRLTVPPDAAAGPGLIRLTVSSLSSAFTIGEYEVTYQVVKN